MLPCPDSIIRAVNELGIKNKRERYGRTLEFRNRKKIEYEWDEDSLEEDEAAVEYTSHPEMAAEMPGVTWAADLPDLTPRDDDSVSSNDSDDSPDMWDEDHDPVLDTNTTDMTENDGTGVSDYEQSAGVPEDSLDHKASSREVLASLSKLRCCAL
jgi:hypothetical protein